MVSQRALLLAAFVSLASCCLAATQLAASELVQRGGLRVTYSGELSPNSLPREGAAPVEVSVGGKISTADGSQPPALRSFEVAINRHGLLNSSALPVCPLGAIQPASSGVALAACRSSLVGEGSFAAAVAIPEQSPFPSRGKILAFNGRSGGRPAILAHIYGTEPLPTSFTVPLTINTKGSGYGATLRGELPDLAANIAYVTEISITLGRSFSRGGKRRGYLEASCPAPAGFPGAVFPLMKTSFHFADGRNLSSTLNRSCRAIG